MAPGWRCLLLRWAIAAGAADDCFAAVPYPRGRMMFGQRVRQKNRKAMQQEAQTAEGQLQSSRGCRGWP